MLQSSGCLSRQYGACRGGHPKPTSFGRVLHHAPLCRSFRGGGFTDVEVEQDVPNAGPGRWGTGGPPPPPPPPPEQKRTFSLPNRRDFLLTALGLGLGVGGTALFYNTVYDLSDEGATNGLDAMMDDPEFMKLMREEVLEEAELASFEASAQELEGLQTLDQQVTEMGQVLNDVAKELQEENDKLTALKKSAGETAAEKPK